MKKKYDDLVNIDNIISLSKKKIAIIFEDEVLLNKEIYLHNIINQWYEKNDENEANLKIIRKLIKKTQINLNEIEEHNIELIEERIFSIDRHIKILDVNLKLENKESIGAKYTDARLYTLKNRLNFESEGDILMSNKRILMNSKSDLSFYWKHMEDVKFQKYGFQFQYDKLIYIIRIHDQITLNNTIKNFVGKKVKKWKYEKF